MDTDYLSTDWSQAEALMKEESWMSYWHWSGSRLSASMNGIRRLGIWFCDIANDIAFKEASSSSSVSIQLVTISLPSFLCAFVCSLTAAGERSLSIALHVDLWVYTDHSVFYLHNMVYWLTDWLDWWRFPPSSHHHPPHLACVYSAQALVVSQSAQYNIEKSCNSPARHN